MMTILTMFRRALPLVLVVCTGLSAGCASDAVQTPALSLAASAVAVPEGPAEEGSAEDTTTTYDDNASYVGSAVYRCDDGRAVDITNEETVVTLAQDDGSTLRLPASPADSRTRYAEKQYAVVFDGEEILFFRPKTEPATCRRTA